MDTGTPAPRHLPQLTAPGGKGAAVAFDDAAVGSAVAGIGTVSFRSGQIRTAPTRVLVQQGVCEHLVDQLNAYAGCLKVVAPREPETVVGPVRVVTRNLWRCSTSPLEPLALNAPGKSGW
jgi:acyl-CoA reductase-like NAD-dependent aldehyde dehydrogenase